MAESVRMLERRIDDLRVAVRRSVSARDAARTRALRAELRVAERAWERAITDLAEAAETGTDADAVSTADAVSAVTGDRDVDTAVTGDGGVEAARPTASLVPVREQVHHALTLLSVPAAPKLIAEVHAAFCGAEGVGLAATRLTHLRRDEKRSFHTARGCRPYYLCATLTAENLTPARGLLAVSTWPLQRRIVGPLSPRVDFLTAAVRVAERAGGGAPEGNARIRRLLWRFAANIPGAADQHDTMDPSMVIEAARAELAVHADADRSQRAAAADRARRQLDEGSQLFGSPIELIRGRTA